MPSPAALRQQRQAGGAATIRASAARRMHGVTVTERLEQLLHLALAVGEGVQADADLIQQREVQIGQRRRLLVRDVTCRPSCFRRRRPPPGSAGSRDRARSALPMPLPYRYMEWSSSVPLPSGVAFSFSRKYANSDTWNALIFATFASFSGSLPWCVSGWCGSGTPISG